MARSAIARHTYAHRDRFKPGLGGGTLRESTPRTTAIEMKLRSYDAPGPSVFQMSLAIFHEPSGLPTVDAQPRERCVGCVFEGGRGAAASEGKIAIALNIVDVQRERSWSRELL